MTFTQRFVSLNHPSKDDVDSPSIQNDLPSNLPSAIYWSAEAILRAASARLIQGDTM